MPENCEFDENEASEFINNGGVSKNTKLCKERAVSHFMNYVNSNFPVNEENGRFWEDKIKLEKALVQYFSTYIFKYFVSFLDSQARCHME